MVRLFHPTPLSEGLHIILTQTQVHYLAHVMRHSINDTYQAFNGINGEWNVRIVSLGKRGGEAVVEACIRPQRAEPGCTLAFSPLKQARQDILLEKATELGVQKLWPVMMDRSIVRDFRPARAMPRILEAAEQCERLTVPSLEKLGRLEALKDVSCPIAICHERKGSISLASFAGAHSGQEVLFVIGPEGGFTEGEEKLLKSFPNTTFLTLGPRILRSETAALMVVGYWQNLLDS